jgi:hypothetical protein
MKLPSLPFAEFSNLAGPELFADLCRLYVSRENQHLVLFCDPSRRHVAILPVGPAHTYPLLEAVTPKVKIEGLSPLCSLCTPEAATVPANDPFAAEWQRLQARQQDLEKGESDLRQREHYVAECEARMGEVGQSLTEREAWIEQREQIVAGRERAFFKRSGEQAPRLEVAAEVMRA